MKLMTKRLLAVALVAVMTMCMAMTAMASVNGISDGDLQAAGYDVSKAVEIGRLDVTPKYGKDSKTPSPEAGQGYTVAKDGSVTINFSYLGDLSKYVKLGIFHKKSDGSVEYKTGISAVFTSASPFILVGEPKEEAIVEPVDDGSDAVVDDGDDDSGSSSSKKSSSKKSSSKSKSPKTGMDESWMLWLIAAGVLAGSSVVAYNKKRG